MRHPDSARTRVEADGVVLDAVFARNGEGLRVAYRIHNTAAVPAVVFDRGDRHAVLTRRQAAGDVGTPRLDDDGQGAVTLVHLARALPRPSPTLPPTPLVRRIAPGACADARFNVTHWVTGTPVRVRWCLGVARADPARLFAPERHGDIDLWQADFAYVHDQRRLCTPWFDMARGVFDSPAA